MNRMLEEDPKKDLQLYGSRKNREYHDFSHFVEREGTELFETYPPDLSGIY